MTCERMMLPKYRTGTSAQVRLCGPPLGIGDRFFSWVSSIATLFNNVASVVVWLWCILDEDIEVYRYYDEYVAIGNW